MEYTSITHKYHCNYVGEIFLQILDFYIILYLQYFIFFRYNYYYILSFIHATIYGLNQVQKLNIFCKYQFNKNTLIDNKQQKEKKLYTSKHTNIYKKNFLLDLICFSTSFTTSIVRVSCYNTYANSIILELCLQ